MHPSPGFVYCVYCLIGEVSVGYITIGEFYSTLQSLIRIVYSVVFFVDPFDVFEDVEGLFGGGGIDNNLLESSLQCPIFLNAFAILRKSSCPYAADLSSGECRLEYIGHIHTPLGGAGSYYGVDLVYE